MTELLALPGICDALPEDATRHAARQRRDVEATTIQHLHGRLEAFAGPSPDDVGGGHADVVEDDVAGLRAALPHLAIGLAERQSGKAGRHDERRDTAGTGSFGAGHQREGVPVSLEYVK